MNVRLQKQRTGVQYNSAVACQVSLRDCGLCSVVVRQTLERCRTDTASASSWWHPSLCADTSRQMPLSGPWRILPTTFIIDIPVDARPYQKNPITPGS
jgi:hypothetical protein